MFHFLLILRIAFGSVYFYIMCLVLLVSVLVSFFSPPFVFRKHKAMVYYCNVTAVSACRHVFLQFHQISRCRVQYILITVISSSM